MIDEQHRELFRIINELHDARKLGKGNEVVHATIGALVSYTRHHFKCEEKLMTDHGYPKFAAHKKIHDELTRQVQQMADSEKAGKGVLTAELSSFLANWLAHHINDVDKAMIQHLVAGAGPVSRTPRP